MFKKILLGIFLFSGIGVSQPYITGSGTDANPYLLYTAAHVDSIRHLGLDKVYSIQNDINLGSIANWVPIGSFTGKIHGNGYALDSLKRTSHPGAYGFFIEIFGFPSGTDSTILFIKDLTFTNPQINYAFNNASGRYGIVVGGLGRGMLKNVHIRGGLVNMVANSQFESFGGLVGNASTGGLISECSVEDLAIIRNNGTVQGIIGGLVGRMQNSAIERSYVKNIYILSRRTYDTMGSIVGMITTGVNVNSIRDCYSMYSTVRDSMSTVIGHFEFAGGFVGQLHSNNVITRTYSISKATHRLAFSWDNIYIGRPNNNNILKSFADTTYWGISKISIVGSSGKLPVGKDSTSMKMQSTYTDSSWDFNTVWGIHPSYNDGYPYLRWEDPVLSMAIIEPTLDTVYNYTSTLTIKWTVEDTALAYYKDGYRDPVFIDTIMGMSSVWDFITDRVLSDSLKILLVSLSLADTAESDIFSTKGFLELISPLTTDTYLLGDTIAIQFNHKGMNNAYLEYSTDNMFSWSPLATISWPDTNHTYLWTSFPSGNIYIRVRDLYTYLADTSAMQITFSEKLLDIISPIDQTFTFSVGTQISIEVAVWNIPKFSLYYAIGDTLQWILIEKDIPVLNAVDTITYNWTAPSIYGEIWLLAREISDTAIYNFERSALNLGNIKRSFPQICWYTQGYFSLPFVNYQQSLVEWNWFVDGSCGWASSHPGEKVTAIIDDKAANPYTFLTSSGNDGGGRTYALQAGGVFLYTLLDTAYFRYTDFYNRRGTTNDTLLYKSRLYFVDKSDSTVKIKDLINNLDSILFLDLKPSFNSLVVRWTQFPTMMQIYNVQRTKINGQYFPVNYDFESLNDSDFNPMFLIGGPRVGGGFYVVTSQMLEEPVSQYYIYDIERIFTSLSYTRNYFRGIHPKAEKRKDPNVIN